MKRTNLLNRFVSLLLCAAMVITYLPGTSFIFAEDGGGDESAPAAVENPTPSDSGSSNAEPEKEKKAPEAPAPVEPSLQTGTYCFPSAEPDPEKQASYKTRDFPSFINCSC